MKIHPTADVQSKTIGEGTTVWQFAVILPGAIIGKNCNISSHTFIENDVFIGDNVTVKSGISIWDATRIEDDVFLGPNVVFTNDLYPRSKHRAAYPISTVKRGASVGANSTILAGVTIGKYSMTGIGSVITRNVPDYALMYGNPARQHGWVDEKGNKLAEVDKKKWINKEGTQYQETKSGLIRL